MEPWLPRASDLYSTWARRREVAVRCRHTNVPQHAYNGHEKFDLILRHESGTRARGAYMRDPVYEQSAAQDPGA